MVRDIALFAAWTVAMGLLLWAYLAISRSFRRDRDEVLRSLAGPRQVAAILRFPGSAGCSHFAIGGNVIWAACAICGPLEEVS